MRWEGRGHFGYGLFDYRAGAGGWRDYGTDDEGDEEDGVLASSCIDPPFVDDVDDSLADYEGVFGAFSGLSTSLSSLPALSLLSSFCSAGGKY